MSSTETFRPGPPLSEGLSAALNAGPSMLRATTECAGSAVLVRAVGEIDASNVACWRWLLREVAQATEAPGPLLVDVGGLEFIACCGLAALAEESKRCLRRSVVLCLVSNRVVVDRIIAAGQWQPELRRYGNAHAALEAVREL